MNREFGNKTRAKQQQQQQGLKMTGNEKEIHSTSASTV